MRKFKISATASGNVDVVETDGQNNLPINTSDKKVCAEVFSIAGDQIFKVESRDSSGSPLNLDWIVEAKRRWGRHYAKTEANKCFALLSEDSNAKRDNVVQRKETATRQNSMLDAKSECSDLGFSSGTEKHGECVLRLLELRN